MFKKANWTDLKSHAETVCSEVLNAPTDTNANDLWLIFKNGLTEGVKLFIPTRQQKHKIDLPYMTDEIKLLIRRRDRLYDRMKKARRNVYTVDFRNPGLRAQISGGPSEAGFLLSFSVFSLFGVVWFTLLGTVFFPFNGLLVYVVNSNN